MKIGYTDVHCHLLPQVDDGARSREEVVQMLHQAEQEGIQKIFLTPHYVSGCTKISRKKKQSLIEEVQRDLLQERNIQLIEGNELYYSPGIIDDLKEGRAATMGNSRYVLVEFSETEIYRELYHGMRQFLEAGYRPILAHMERYQCIRGDREKLLELQKLGVVLQMNVRSLQGNLFDRDMRYHRRLLQEGYVQLLGTDAHGSNYREPVMDTVIKSLEGKISPARLQQVLYQNTECLMQDQYIRRE